MPSMKDTTTVAIASDSGNVLAGLDFEFIDTPALITVWASSDDPANITMTFQVGTQVLANNVRPNLETAVAAINLDRDRIIDRQLVAGGRLSLDFRNTDAAATQEANWQVQVDVA